MANHKGGRLTSCFLLSANPRLRQLIHAVLSPGRSFTGTQYNLWKKKETTSANVPNPEASYKEAFLQHVQQPESVKPLKLAHHTSHFHIPNLMGRCFRCLAKDHKIRECREPRRCTLCFRFGHPARYCRKCGAVGREKMQHALHFRPPLIKVFIPLTEGFHSRQNLCRNIVLANIIGPANLGHYHQETIANDFAIKLAVFLTTSM